MHRIAIALAALALTGGVHAQTLRVELGAGDYVDARLESPRAAWLEVTGPDGRVLRRMQAEPGETELLFVAEHAGTYVLRARGDGPADGADATRALSLHEHVPAAALKAPPPAREAPPQSARVQGWIAAHGAGTPAFWVEAQRHGTPIVEPIDGSTSQLVTFLWRGAGTRSVRPFWAIRTAEPEAFARVAGTDVWHLSMRLPAATRMSYQLAPDVPQFGEGPRLRQRRAVLAVAQADPLNPQRWPRFDDADRFATASLVELARAPAEPWLAPRADVPRGALQTLRFRSARLGNERDVTLYTPPGHVPGRGAPLPVLVLFDRDAYLTRVPTPTILDNLIAAGRIPPIAAVLIANPSREARSAELPCNPGFADVLVEELLPWVRKQVNITGDAARVVAAGSSYGGLAATCLALRHPQVVGRVLSLSGSYWWSPERDPRAPVGGLDDVAESEWVARQFAQAGRGDTVFFLAPGLFERSAPGDSIGILDANRHLRNVLQAKGYRVHYREFAGGHDYANWRGELPEGLIALLGSVAAKP